MTFEKEINWGDVILAALFKLSNTDDEVTIAVPDDNTAKIVIQTLASLQEAGDLDVWRINVKIDTTH
jgi:hypothetical protein|tara:strand:- start:309 stop:509 length:201 start_codon:yes stop_codon:yes gene_type:complete